MTFLQRFVFFALAAAVSLSFSSCATRPGTLSKRSGDEIVVAGQLFHTGTRIVTWMDPGGYDAYRVERRFSPIDESDWENSRQKVEELRSPARYNMRKAGLTNDQIEEYRGGGWKLRDLQEVVDQFVLHYDQAGTSRTCFRVLHDVRGLSVHFMLDVDGTIYQTLDLKERAWHATTSNTRSVGIEIANIGAYESDEKNPFNQWYRKVDGNTELVIPKGFHPEAIRTPNFVGHPAQNELVTGTIQGRTLQQYDLTPQQYEALVKLTATLCKVFPKIKCDYPRDAQGNLIRAKLPDDELDKYHGVLGHFHVQTNKVDPGPAFQWDYLIGNARKYLPSSTSNERAGYAHMKPNSPKAAQ